VTAPKPVGVTVGLNRRGTPRRPIVNPKGESRRAARRRRDRAATRQRVDQPPIHPAIAASKEKP
jgi:hypothetical protein